MPNASLSASVQSMPDDPTHPDAAIFAAARAVVAIDREVARAISRTDPITAQLEGRAVTAAETKTFDTTERAYDHALDALLALTPKTVAGVRVMLETITKDAGYDRHETISAIERIAASPALAGSA